MNEKRKRLLIELENIIGNEFYNGNIQNWGPGSVFEGEGRALRYPLTLRGNDGKTIKTKHVDPALPAETVITGMYRLGANELSIVRALDLVVSHLERGYGLNFGRGASRRWGVVSGGAEASVALIWPPTPSATPRTPRA